MTHWKWRSLNAPVYPCMVLFQDIIVYLSTGELSYHMKRGKLYKIYAVLYGHPDYVFTLHIMKREPKRLFWCNWVNSYICIGCCSIKWTLCSYIWIAKKWLTSQRTVQARCVGGEELTAFIKASVLGDRTFIRKKPLHNPLYGPVNNILR